jgi:hypothetical protein
MTADRGRQAAEDSETEKWGNGVEKNNRTRRTMESRSYRTTVPQSCRYKSYSESYSPIPALCSSF